MDSHFLSFGLSIFKKSVPYMFNYLNSHIFSFFTIFSWYICSILYFPLMIFLLTNATKILIKKLLLNLSFSGPPIYFFACISSCYNLLILRVIATISCHGVLLFSWVRLWFLLLQHSTWLQNVQWSSSFLKHKFTVS